MDWTNDAKRSTIVDIEGIDVDGRGCREYVNWTVDGDGRCCVRDIVLSAYHAVSLAQVFDNESRLRSSMLKSQRQLT